MGCKAPEQLSNANAGTGPQVSRMKPDATTERMPTDGRTAENIEMLSPLSPSGSVTRMSGNISPLDKHIDPLPEGKDADKNVVWINFPEV